jgi:hypothetical protein
MDDSRPMIHIRLPKPLVRRIDHVSVDLDIDRARTIEHLIEVALDCLEQHHPGGLGISAEQVARN